MKTKDEILEALKNNKIPFGMMDEEEQRVLREIPHKHRLVYGGSPGYPYEWKLTEHDDVCWRYTYRIDRAYQFPPEPDFKDYYGLPISRNAEGVLVFVSKNLPPFQIDSALRFPDFGGFWFPQWPGRILPTTVAWSCEEDDFPRCGLTRQIVGAKIHNATHVMFRKEK